MCGICGVVSWRAPAPEHHAEVARMAGVIRHRGPDGQGIAGTSEAVIACQRLRIIDTSERADQPFVAPGGGWAVACNGEIYNSGELRARYPDYPYRSRSDVETLVPLFAARGADAVAELDGMFGLAAWRPGELVLARDRAGEKPLYYARLGRELWFASEVAALLGVPGVDTSVDPVALSQLLTLGYVLEPCTMFAGIRQVPAGSYMVFDRGGERTVRYWRPEELAPLPDAPARQRVEELRELLRDAARRQVVADVPVGVFISGGLDSSLLAALAIEQLGPSRVHTFAAAFEAASYDESDVAATVARGLGLGTRHVTVRCDEPRLLEALRTFTAASAEPLADPAVLPTMLLARAAREHVTVVLSGEGADELFGGYPTYLGHKVAPMFAGLPRPLRAAVERGVGGLRSSPGKVTIEFLLKRFVADASRPWPERHLRWFGTGLPEQPSERRAEWLAPLLAAAEADGERVGPLRLDYRTYLRDDLLVKVDRATMKSSIEARAPYLDRAVTAFAWRLPMALKVRRFESKWILKRAAEAWLPREITHRRKRGLSVPVASWLGDGLRPVVDRLLDPALLRTQGILDPGLVHRMLGEHRAGTANHARPLWAALTLQLWLERWQPSLAIPESPPGLAAAATATAVAANG